MIMTSRREDSLSSFGNFQLFEIKPLELKESFNSTLSYSYINILFSLTLCRSGFG